MTAWITQVGSVPGLDSGSGAGSGSPDPPEGRLPPGNDPRNPMPDGWLSTQINTSLIIGVTSILLFTFLRRKFTGFYAPAPAVSTAWLGSGLWGWIRPLWAIDEAAHLSAIGIDGLVLLDFLQMAALIFLGVSVWSVAVVMPTNWLKFGTIDGVPPDQDANSTMQAIPFPYWTYHLGLPSNILLDQDDGPLPIKPGPDFPAPQRFNVIHVVTEVVITVYVLYLLFRASRRVSRVHQEYNVQVATKGARIAALPSRTIEVRQIPRAWYNTPSIRSLFDQMGFHPEGLSFARDPTYLQLALAQRALAQIRLESAWSAFLKNRYAADPSERHPGSATADEQYDPNQILDALLKDWDTYARDTPRYQDPESGPTLSNIEAAEESAPLLTSADHDSESNGHQRPEEPDAETTQTPATTNGTVTPSDTTATDTTLRLLSQPLYVSRQRPWGRALWWNFLSPSVDMLPHLQIQFFNAHAKVLRERQRMQDPTPLLSPTTRQKRTVGTGVAFITLDRVSDAQILSQALYASEPGTFVTRLASGPGEVVWSNMNMGLFSEQVRQHFVTLLVFLILVFYIPPLLALYSLVSDFALQKYIPGLSYFLSQHPQLQALFQDALPSLVLVSWNNMLPTLFESLAYVQGARDSAQIQLTVLQRYYNYLLVSVVFIALITKSMLALLAELAENPAGFLSHLGSVLPIARNFSTSYVILQALGLVPLQLLCAPTAFRSLWAYLTTDNGQSRRAIREPLLPGTVYPQALIVFTLATLYANVAPRITLFATVYFILFYGVVKYKLFFMHASASPSPSPLAPPPTRAALDEDHAAATPETDASITDSLAEARAWSTGAGQIHVLAISRCIWALVLYQIFQLSQVLVRRQTLLALVHVPLLICTLLAWRYLSDLVTPSKKYTNLAALKAAENNGTVEPTAFGSFATPATPTTPATPATPGAPVLASVSQTPTSSGSEALCASNHTVTLYHHPVLDESSVLPTIRLPKAKRS